MPRAFALTAAALLAAVLLAGCDSLSGEPRMPEPGTPSWERTGSDTVNVSRADASVSPAGPTYWDEEARARGARPQSPDYGYIRPGREVRTSAWRGTDWAEPLPTGEWATALPSASWSETTAVMVTVEEQGETQDTFVVEIEETGPAPRQERSTPSRSAAYGPQAHSTPGSSSTAMTPARTAPTRTPARTMTPAPTQPARTMTPAPAPQRPAPTVPRRGYTPPPPPR